MPNAKAIRFAETAIAKGVEVTGFRGGKEIGESYAIFAATALLERAGTDFNRTINETTILMPVNKSNACITFSPIINDIIKVKSEAKQWSVVTVRTQVLRGVDDHVYYQVLARTS